MYAGTVTQLSLSLSLILVVSALEQLLTGWETREKVQDDYESVLYPEKGSSPRFDSYIMKKTVPSSGRNYTLYIGLLRDGLPDAFALELPVGGKIIQ